ncbi:MAG TPA: hypothetical protein VMB50_19230 [Myxococcales bacterium]|nr:hypothetical protein [Myxococcales bacterium]
MTSRSTAIAPFLALLAACSSKPAPVDSGTTVPDVCNNQSDAQTDPACQLTGGKQASFYIDHLGKELWLGFTLPALTPQSLLSIQAGYNPQIGSPVELALSVVNASGGPLVERVADDHDPGPPGLLNIVDPLPSSVSAGQMIFLEFSDDSGTHFDATNPFYVTVSVIPDPDPNQPGTPTTVTLSAPDSNGVQTATPVPTGVISTAGRVDEYAITIPSGVQRPILYFAITLPSEAGDGGILSPPINFIMGYNLYDCGTQDVATCAGMPPATPSGALTATDCMANTLQVVHLDAAWLVKPGDNYLLEVAACPNTGGKAVEGDLRSLYDLNMEVLPDTDPYDVPAPTPISLSLNGGQQQLPPGRLCHQNQTDLYPIQLSAQGKNTRIHYVFTPSPVGTVGRFPALSEYRWPVPTRVADFFTPVAASATPPAWTDCENSQSTCPNDTADLLVNGPAALGLVDNFCEADGGPFCLYSYRQEDSSDFTNLQNFEGIIPVNAGTSEVYLSYQDQEGHWADDTPYTVTLDWLDEGSENQAAYHETEASAIDANPLTVDVPPSGSFPAPPAGATTLTGTITVGNTFESSVSGTNDYDAIPSTLDVWEMDIPSVPLGTALGETWELSWQISGGGSGGQPVCSLGLAPLFCDPQGNCEGPLGTDPFDGLQMLGTDTGSISTWYGGYATVWTTSGGTYTAQAGSCYCFDPNDVGGKFYLAVLCTGRTTYAADPTYVIQTAVTTYPQPDGDGGMCPASDAGIPDGGTLPRVKGCGMDKTKPSCGSQGDQCTANADCCSLSCSTQNISPTGGFSGYGQCN